MQWVNLHPSRGKRYKLILPFNEEEIRLILILPFNEEKNAMG